VEKAKCNILVWGMVSTGSSALIDVLREYDNIHIIPGEFDDFRAPGRIADQLVFPESEKFNRIRDVKVKKSKYPVILGVIKRVLKGEINSKVKLDEYITPIQIRTKQLSLLKKLNEKITSEISFDEKIDLVSNWIKEIGQFKNEYKNFVLFNQPLTPSIETRIWKRVFSPFKFICVYRDPKDQLAEIIRKGILYAPYGAPYMNHGGLALESIYGRSRQAAIRLHIEALKKRMEWIDSLKTELNEDEFLLIDFEGLINNYESYRKTVENFIGEINPNPDKYIKYYNPVNARKSIGIYNLILQDKDLEELKPLEDWYIRTKNSNPVQLEASGE
jgi:hypothetical protein